MLSNSLSLPSFRYTVAQHRARPRYSNVIKYSLHNKAGHVAAIISADISISRILAGIQSFSSTASNLIVITYAPPPLPPRVRSNIKSFGRGYTRNITSAALAKTINVGVNVRMAGIYLVK